ncbi:MAG: TipAS antibiotic-recognition domain-containing protein [Chloroflexi bacterium]|nr:TipAS antibiotic-recognition domain-containing protein [Chloroflexota bacterium]
MERLIQSVDRTLDAMERGTTVDEKDMFDGFDEAKQQEYREEASARWGKEMVDESYRRVAHYTKEDWARLKAQGKRWIEEFALLMGRDPADAEVQRRIGEHYRAIHDNFSTPTPEVYRGLGDLYVQDPRFTANYDTVRPGLAAFMRLAMHVYADGMEAAAA